MLAMNSIQGDTRRLVRIETPRSGEDIHRPYISSHCEMQHRGHFICIDAKRRRCDHASERSKALSF